MQEQEKLPAGYSTPSEIDEAEENLVRCLDALDKDGDAGLQKEMDRIYPGTSPEPGPVSTGHRRIEMVPGIWIQQMDTPLPSTPATQGLPSHKHVPFMSGSSMMQFDEPQVKVKK